MDLKFILRVMFILGKENDDPQLGSMLFISPVIRSYLFLYSTKQKNEQSGQNYSCLE